MTTGKFLLTMLGAIAGIAVAAQSPSQRIFFVSSDPAQPISYNKMREIDGKCKVLVKDWFQPNQKYAVKTHGFQTYLALQQSAFISDASGHPDTLRSPIGYFISPCLHRNSATWTSASLSHILPI